MEDFLPYVFLIAGFVCAAFNIGFLVEKGLDVGKAICAASCSTMGVYMGPFWGNAHGNAFWGVLAALTMTAMAMNAYSEWREL